MKPLYLDTPAGRFEAPSWLRDKFRAMTDEELAADELNTSRFIDPVAFTVAFKERGFIQWRTDKRWIVGTPEMKKVNQ